MLFVNLGHLVAHYALLIFPSVIVFLEKDLGQSYSDLLRCAVPGYIAFGLGSAISGWLGDKWGRRRMMALYFLGVAAAAILAGIAQSPLGLGAALCLLGLFLSIYHPIGTTLVAEHDRRIGRQIGMNAVWGNIGVASSAVATTALAQAYGWRTAFLVPGVVSLLAGIGFLLLTADHSARSASSQRLGADATPASFVATLAAIGVLACSASIAFSVVTTILPRLLIVRLEAAEASLLAVGGATSGLYLLGTTTQLSAGFFVDRVGVRATCLVMSVALAVSLFLASVAIDLLILPCVAVVVMTLFGLGTIIDAAIGRHASDRWRSRAYSMRYFASFTVANAAIALVPSLYDNGGFTTVLSALVVVACFSIPAAMLLPSAQKGGVALGRR